MGIEWALTFRTWRFEDTGDREVRQKGARIAARTSLQAAWRRICAVVLNTCSDLGTTRAGVPEQAGSSRMDGCYEVSGEFSRSTDLQRIC